LLKLLENATGVCFLEPQCKQDFLIMGQTGMWMYCVLGMSHCPYLHSFVTKRDILKTNEPISVPIDTSGSLGKGIKELYWSRGRRSRSHNVKGHSRRQIWKPGKGIILFNFSLSSFSSCFLIVKNHLRK